MKKAHLYEAVFLLNQGLDQAIYGLERLKRAKGSGLDAACLTEKLTLFELHRCSLNSYLCSKFNAMEQNDLLRFENFHREFEELALDEIQVYRDVLAVEQRRRSEGKPPKVRFLNYDEQSTEEDTSTGRSRGESGRASDERGRPRG
jgi:hypothetical protein